MNHHHVNRAIHHPPRQSRITLATLVATLASLALLSSAGGGDTPATGEWKYDVVYRKGGVQIRGLVLVETPSVVRVQCISRRPGSPTVVYPIELPREEVIRVELLPDEEREQLRHRLEALRDERRVLIDRLRVLDPGAPAPRRSSDTVELRPATWVLAGKTPALEYRSTYFNLISSARREVVELAAIHLEQVYAAYARFLPPRATASPTRIILAGSLADYQELLRGSGLTLTNPAFYDTERNQVVCVSTLERLADDLERTRQHHRKLVGQLQEREKELKEAYRGTVPAAILAPLEKARKDIEATETRNLQVFRRARDRLFQRLYHEAFHAYLANFVYPPADATVPRWLNEGLAQIFETAIVEVGELRIGHADPERLAAVRQALAEDRLLPLDELLRGTAKQFQVAHGGDRQVSDRHYLASWALACYLTFDQKLLGTPALDEYTRSLRRGTDAVEAFRALVKRPLAEFEKEFHEYLKHLRPEGAQADDS
jgi:hypothetical protein